MLLSVMEGNSYFECVASGEPHVKIMHVSAALKCHTMKLSLKYKNVSKSRLSLEPYFPFSSQRFDLVSGLLHSLQIRPLMNLQFHHLLK